MLKIIFIFIIFLTNLFSSKFYLNPHYENKIQINTQSYYIIKDYIRFLNEISSLSEKKQIDKVNTYINAINPKYDSDNYKNNEYWATIYEFLSKGGGDCEDYVIAKGYTLELLGINKDNIFYTIVKEKYLGGDHMVLALHVNKKKSFIILDNLSTKVLSLAQRIDLKAIVFFNESGFFEINENARFVRIRPLYIQAYEEKKMRNIIPLVLVH